MVDGFHSHSLLGLRAEIKSDAKVKGRAPRTSGAGQDVAQAFLVWTSPQSPGSEGADLMEGQTDWLMCGHTRQTSQPGPLPVILIYPPHGKGFRSFVVSPVTFLALTILPGPLLILNKHWFNKCIDNLQVRFEYWLLIDVFLRLILFFLHF